MRVKLYHDGVHKLEWCNHDDGSTEYHLYSGEYTVLWFRLAARGHVLVRFQ